MPFRRGGPSAQPPTATKKAPIDIKPSHEGLLHQDVGVPQGAPIPMATEVQAAANPNPQIARRGQFALNARKFNK